MKDIFQFDYSHCAHLFEGFMLIDLFYLLIHWEDQLNANKDEHLFKASWPFLKLINYFL